jgi:hypothetical protein
MEAPCLNSNMSFEVPLESSGDSGICLTLEKMKVERKTPMNARI